MGKRSHGDDVLTHDVRAALLDFSTAQPPLAAIHSQRRARWPARGLRPTTNQRPARVDGACADHRRRREVPNHADQLRRADLRREPYRGARGTTYTVRWRVQGLRFRRTFTTKKLADGFRSKLQVATQAGEAFVVENGLPVSMQEPTRQRTWLGHAMGYVDTKWPHASPRHRKGIAEALTDVTIATLPDLTGAPAVDRMRRVLFRWTFNSAGRSAAMDGEDAAALAWLEKHSPPLASFSTSATLRQALDRLALRQDGRPAAASTVARKRATLHNVLEYAVELETFPSNPLHRVRWRPQDHRGRRPACRGQPHPGPRPARRRPGRLPLARGLLRVPVLRRPPAGRGP